MSKLTEVLKLLCYDPETDGNLTFNVTEALTKNWEKIDQLVLLAVAAAGAYNPEGSYAVGDYCTHSGKLHKCSTAIPDGEAWNAEHWTETTVAAELATRLSLSGGMMMGAITWPHEQYFGPGAESSQLDWKSGICSIRLIPENANGMNISKCVVIRNTVNGDLSPISTATPPTVRNLTLQSGFVVENGCVYWKTQENIVTIMGGVWHNTGNLQIDQNTQIGTLIAGYYPINKVRCNAVTASGSAYVEVHTDGTVWIHPFTSDNRCWFFIQYEAASKEDYNTYARETM